MNGLTTVKENHFFEAQCQYARGKLYIYNYENI